MSKISTKSKLGQFFTTNFKYILQNLHIPQEIHHIIEPFAGNYKKYTNYKLYILNVIYKKYTNYKLITNIQTIN
jgi:hypothetical protein